MINQDSIILIWMEQVGIKNFLGTDGRMVFENLDLRVDTGEFIVISGVYGKDRLNLINVLGCLSCPDAGKYYFDYNDITTIGLEKRNEIRSRYIGFIFRGLNMIDNLSVYENIKLPLLSGNSEQIETKAAEAAEAFGLKDMLRKKVRELTDIERHRTAIARALVQKPILLIADEPGENLESADSASIIDAISQVNASGTTVIAFSDRPDVIERASRHIVFENGKVKTKEVAV